MYLSRVRSMLEEVGRQGRQGWGGSAPSDNQNSPPSPTTTSFTQQSEEDIQQETERVALSDHEMLARARVAHDDEDFESLAAGPEANGPWKRVETVGRFVVFRRQVSASNRNKRPSRLEVLCAGRLDASLEEVASILRSSSEVEHNAAMTALYAKSFIFGSYEREVSCSRGQDDDALDNIEQLAIKTKSFARTTMLGRNEQWCYFDYFQRKTERDGFTILKRALPPSEPTPGRITGENARVDQLHELNATYLVDKLPDRKGLRVVFRARFEQDTAHLHSSNQSPGDSSSGSRSSSDPSILFNVFENGNTSTGKYKAQLRRLLGMAHGVTKLSELVRRRRFGVQVPANLDVIRSSNVRCPCCTHSLAPVKLSLAMAASAITNRSLSPLRMDTRRCNLCGYLVCVNCWQAEHMESAAGRVAAIVACTRCHANVQACEYSEVFAGTAAEREKHRGPARVVEDPRNTPTVSLLVDFLSTSLLSVRVGSPEHAAVLAVIRTLLRQNEEDPRGDSDDDDADNSEYQRGRPHFEQLDDKAAVAKVGEILSDEQQFPALEDCKLGNAEQRDYSLDLPDDPNVDVPRSPIPSNEADRIASVQAAGLLHFANLFAPVTAPADTSSSLPDVHDLELLCQLAVKTLDCAFSFVTVMCVMHEHVMVGTHPGFVGAAVPREQTGCQHALMSPHPFMVVHHEADVRLHKQGATSQIPIRFYLGFPLTVPRAGGKPDDDEMTVGMLCCIDTKPRAEITRTQYATMKRLTSTATHLLLQKSRRLLQEMLSIQASEERVSVSVESCCVECKSQCK